MVLCNASPNFISFQLLILSSSSALPSFTAIFFSSAFSLENLIMIKLLQASNQSDVLQEARTRSVVNRGRKLLLRISGYIRLQHTFSFFCSLNKY